MRRAPARPVRARFVRLLLSKNMTCVRPRCNTTPSEHVLHTSGCTLHTPHFTLCTSHSTLHLISPHLSSSHLIPSLFTCHLSKFLNCFHFIRALLNLSHLITVRLNSSQLFCAPESFYCQREAFWQKTFLFGPGIHNLSLTKDNQT